MKELRPSDKIVVEKLKAKLKTEYGDFVKAIYCHGSRLKKLSNNSDFDIVIITSEKPDWKLRDQIRDTIYEIGISYNILFDTAFFSKDDFDIRLKEMPFIKSVKSKGILA